jgi:hypothetical protein
MRSNLFQLNVGERPRLRTDLPAHRSLGDAELIIGFSAVGDRGDGRLKGAPGRTGSIDTPTVATLVKEILVSVSEIASHIGGSV